MISTFTLVPFSNKLLTLVILPSGGASYLPASGLSKLFHFNYFPTLSSRIRSWFRNPTFFLMYHIRTLAKISMFELFPGAGIKYARSAGVSAKILRFNYAEHVCVVRLPSGVRKKVSLYSIVSLGPATLRDARYVRNTKA